MKLSLSLFFVSFCSFALAQNLQTPKNIFIITTDGLRWQEVFTGADTSLIHNTKFVKDTAMLQELYGDSTPELRRQKLMPFFWNVIAKKGQLSGNRLYNNKVNVSNFYKISYPGYNEILTGYADPKPIFNSPWPNKNINILEYLNKQEEYAGKVVAFSSWNIFPYILNEDRSDMEVNSGYDPIREDDSTSVYINQVQTNVIQKTHCRYDQLTNLSAREYIQEHHPRVVMIGFGETDEFAHQKKYDLYLQQANNIDKMIAQLWYYVQTDPFYKNNTTFIITTDHGRGRKTTSWFAHNLFVKGSGETWQAMLGPQIAPVGEIKAPQQTYQKQIAATVAMLLGKKFESNHKAAEALILQTTLTGAAIKTVVVENKNGRFLEK
jgi:hypothetical protein